MGQDDLDETVLRMLQGNGKMSIEEIAEKLDRSPSTIRDRVRRMEEERLILGYSTIIDQERLEIEAEALSIPEQITVSVEDVEAGTQILAGQITLPRGVTLVSDPELLVVNVVVAPTAEELDAEGAGAPEGAEPAEAEEPAADEAADSAAE